MRVVGGGICGVLVLEVRDVLEIEGPLIDVHFKLGHRSGLRMVQRLWEKGKPYTSYKTVS